MNTKTMSDNACYAFMRMAIPLSFNNARHRLGFESFAYSDVTRAKYRFYAFKGLYWYCIIMLDGHMMNSLPFVSLSNCVRDFRSFLDAIDWQLENSRGLADFVAQYNLTHHERSV